MELFSLPPLFLSYFQKKYVWFFVFFCDLYSTYVLILSLNAYSSGYTKSPSTSNQKKRTSICFSLRCHSSGFILLFFF